MLLIALVFLLGTRSLTIPRGVTTGPGTSSMGALPGAFAHTLVPIAAGYAIAHYLSLLIFDGQQTLILASDPFASGLNLLGIANGSINCSDQHIHRRDRPGGRDRARTPGRPPPARMTRPSGCSPPRPRYEPSTRWSRRWSR